jgi:hypothetical protein
MPTRAAITEVQGKAQLRRMVLVLALSAGLALGAAACGGAPGNPSASASGTAQTVGSGSGGGQGGGPVSIQGGTAKQDGGTGGGSAQRSTGPSFSLAFARCMRAHGVPKFPDPDGKGGQLGPSSGADPASAAFQAALNGPCRSLAPPAWVSSGQVSGGS